MLLAVEGGGFFSSSAIGYSKGLSFLLLGLTKKDKDKPMRVLPWNQYQLVDEDSEPDPQLASSKRRVARGCASFVCFGRASTGLDSSPPKGCPNQRQETGELPSVPVNGKDESIIIEEESGSENAILKSSLRKRSKSTPICEGNLECQELFDKIPEPDNACQTGRRSIQWTDVCGGELVEIREFEPSEVGGSDDELDYGNLRACLCRIM